MASPTPQDFAPLVASAGESPSEAASPASPASTTRRRSRGSSFTESVLNSRPPLGALAATGEAFGRAPSWADLRRNSVSSSGRIGMGRRGSSISTGGGLSPTGVNRNIQIQEGIQEGTIEDIREAMRQPAIANSLVDAAEESEKLSSRDSGNPRDGTESMDEENPGAWATTKSGLLEFWKWFTKPVGFFVTIYLLNSTGFFLLSFRELLLTTAKSLPGEGCCFYSCAMLRPQCASRHAMPSTLLAAYGSKSTRKSSIPSSV
jgi:hypothetical protein